jgi:polysaccharide pyruvyl transferase WcaK-like protein
VASGQHLSLIAHVLDNPSTDNDRIACDALAEMLPGSTTVVLPTGLDEVRSVLASKRLVVGARMHACLNALSLGVPTLPWAYSRKFAPLLSDIGWDWVVDLRSDRVAHRSLDMTSALLATGDDEAARARSRAHARLDGMRQLLADLVDV